MMFCIVTSPPVGGRNIANSVSVCLSACLSVAPISRKPHVLISPNFLHVLAVAVARSFSDGNWQAIRYVLPVLWMTSYFRIMERMSHNQTTGMFRRVRQVAAPAAKLLSTIAGLFCRL